MANGNMTHNRKGFAMHKLVVAVLLGGILLVASGSAFGQESAEEAIKKRIMQYEAASNAGRADSMAAIYAVDGTHTFANGVTLRGRAEIAIGLKEQYAGMLKGTQMAITPLQIRLLSADVAVEEASFVIFGLK
ncbi:MAG: SgcJ/EcaC family oxidoreductase, partial [Candidatus Zixiibacteriota bacterium]